MSAFRRELEYFKEDVVPLSQTLHFVATSSADDFNDEPPDDDSSSYNSFLEVKTNRPSDMSFMTHSTSFQELASTAALAGGFTEELLYAMKIRDLKAHLEAKHLSLKSFDTSLLVLHSLDSSIATTLTSTTVIQR